MALAGSDKGEGFIVTLSVLFKSGAVRVFVVDNTPSEVDEMLDKANTLSTISFITQEGRRVLLFTDSLADIEVETTAGGEAPKESEPNKSKETVEVKMPAIKELPKEKNQKGPQAQGESGVGQDKKK